MLEFRLPDVGEGIANAEIIAWQVAVGDHVREHQDLVEIQTDKATVVIPCPASGVVARLCGAEGDIVDVGAVLAVFEAGGDGARSAVPLAAPTTRRLARELGVALEGIEGSGPHGRIVREDVERAAAAAAPAPPAAATPPAAPSAPAPTPGEVIPLRGVRRTIAHNLTRAWLEVPRIVDYREVDATRLLRARDGLRQRARERGDEALAKALTATPFIVRAAVLAAQQHPYVNASIDLEREEITLHGHYHVGIATAGPDGLTVPVVHDADRRSLADLAREIVVLAQAARERRLSPPQLAGATFTVNNFGSLGSWMGTPIVRPPEVVNLGVGAIRDRVVAVDGAPVVRPTLVLSSAADHRLLDGDTLAAFVNDVARLLEEPVLLFEDLG
ncbi:MAG TPA: dihydrolipoamide acetyltransferase family protein [Solirubrobacteraceae bacterium]|nr:dihydrolipoamide acetyltransferase family protein [Solirubrobacteraceae bacterium]